MMKAAPYALLTERSETDTTALTGARMLVMEKCFDALVEEMIADGAVPVNAAVSMLDFLAERFARRAWRHEMLDEGADGKWPTGAPLR